MKVEGELCKALARVSKVELEFKEERDWVSTLSPAQFMHLSS